MKCVRCLRNEGDGFRGYVGDGRAPHVKLARDPEVAQLYLTESVHKFVLQSSIPTQIHQLILYNYE